MQTRPRCSARAGLARDPAELAVHGGGDVPCETERARNRRKALACKNDRTVDALKRGGEFLHLGCRVDALHRRARGWVQATVPARFERARNASEERRLLARTARRPARTLHCAGRPPRADLADRHPLARGLAHAEEDDRRFLVQIDADGHDELRGVDVLVRRRDRLRQSSKHRILVLAAERPARVHVVRTEHHAGEARKGVRVLVHQLLPGDHRRSHPRLARGRDAVGNDLHGFRPGHSDELSVLPDERLNDPLGTLRVRVREPTLVADPLVVDLAVVLRQHPDELAAPRLRGDPAAARAAIARRVGAGHVERARAEAERRRRKRADGADLDDVPTEDAVVRLVLEDSDLLQRAALEQLDEWVAGDLVAEPRASRTQHTALAVELHQRADRNRLREPPLRVDIPGATGPVCKGLILQRALAALVAHRAVERVVDQKELEHTLLAVARELARELRFDDHPVGDRRCARGERFALPFDLDEALPARAERVEQRVVAEARDVLPHLLGCADYERAGRDRDVDTVDREIDRRLLSGQRGTHPSRCAGGTRRRRASSSTSPGRSRSHRARRTIAR